MAGQKSSHPLSPTVTRVLNEFVNAMKEDDGIDGDAVDRLEPLLREPVVPKPEDIKTALFVPPQEGEA